MTEIIDGGFRFDRLEAAIEDPVVGRLIARAREIEELLGEAGTFSDADAKALVAELDATWPFMGMGVKASGRVWFFDEAAGQAEPDPCDDADFISNGFAIVPAPIMIDGEVVATNYRIALHLLRQHPDGRLEAGMGFLDEVAMTYPAESNEFAENKLRLQYPDLMEEIDVRILNGEHEMAALMALRDITITGNDPDYDGEMLRNLAQYLDVTLDFDQDLPYTIALDGKCAAIIQEGGGYVMVNTRGASGLASIEGIRFINLADIEPETAAGAVAPTYIPGIQIGLHRDDKTRPPLALIVPLSSLMAIQSLRASCGAAQLTVH